MIKKFADRLYKQFLYFVCFRLYSRKKSAAENFSGCIRDAKEILIIMPEQEADFELALRLAESRFFAGKKVSLLVRDVKVSSLKSRSKLPCISVDAASINRIKLPARNFSESLKSRKFDVIIDLNLAENVFFSVLSMIMNSKFRVGFKKKYSDKFYNFIIVNNEINSEFSYRNLLNSLEMF